MLQLQQCSSQLALPGRNCCCGSPFLFSPLDKRIADYTLASWTKSALQVQSFVLTYIHCRFLRFLCLCLSFPFPLLFLARQTKTNLCDLPFSFSSARKRQYETSFVQEAPEAPFSRLTYTTDPTPAPLPLFCSAVGGRRDTDLRPQKNCSWSGPSSPQVAEEATYCQNIVFSSQARL